jgi:hypothetical protein
MTQYSVSSECCGQQVDTLYHASEQCLHWVYTDDCSTPWYITSDTMTLTFYTLIMLSCDFNSRTWGLSMSNQPCLNGITTWHAIVTLHNNTIHTSDSSSQLYSHIKVYASVYTKQNTQLRYPCYNTKPKKRFQLYIPTVKLSLEVHVHKCAQHISLGSAHKKFFFHFYKRQTFIEYPQKILFSSTTQIKETKTSLNFFLN